MEHDKFCTYQPERFGHGSVSAVTGLGSSTEYQPFKPCICDALRKARADERENVTRENYVIDQGDPYREAYRLGYEKGAADEREKAAGRARSLERAAAARGERPMDDEIASVWGNNERGESAE